MYFMELCIDRASDSAGEMGDTFSAGIGRCKTHNKQNLLIIRTR